MRFIAGQANNARISQLLVSDDILPVQFDSLWRRNRSAQPERELAVSVLWQAAFDLGKGRDATKPKERSLYRDAYRWVMSNDRTWPFSFINLCDMLNVSPSFLRARLLNGTSAPPVETAA